MVYILTICFIYERKYKRLSRCPVASCRSRCRTSPRIPVQCSFRRRPFCYDQRPSYTSSKYDHKTSVVVVLLVVVVVVAALVVVEEEVGVGVVVVAVVVVVVVVEEVVVVVAV